MRLDKTLKLLICFVMLIPFLNIVQVSAATNYDHDALMEYEGYGKALYESIVEQSTYLTGQYTDNKEYVSESMDEIKDYADFWYNEFKTNVIDACASPYIMDCVGGVTDLGGGLVLSVGDWIKDLFTDYDQELNSDPLPDNAFYNQVFTHSLSSVIINEGWTVIVTFDRFQAVEIPSGSSLTVVIPWRDWDTNIGVSLGSIFENVQLTSANEGIKKMSLGSTSEVVQALRYMGVSMAFKYQGEEKTPNNINPVPPVNTIRDYVNNNPVDVVLPELKPQLVCPDGTQIQMTVEGTTFLSTDGKLMHVNKDGTAMVNSVSCNLDWQKPEVAYVDDKASMTDPNGNWLNLVNGSVLVCIDESCKPEPLDNSLLDYVKNAYNYATGVLKTATDGLKSLATGAKDLTSLFGTFFSWLPTEMVTLMASGLGIMIGLRLFRK